MDFPERSRNEVTDGRRRITPAPSLPELGFSGERRGPVRAVQEAGIWDSMGGSLRGL